MISLKPYCFEYMYWLLFHKYIEQGALFDFEMPTIFYDELWNKL